MADGETFTPDEQRRLDDADARVYERLYAAAASTLGTGSARLGDTLAIWYPAEREAGYSYLMNFHRAADLDRAYADGIAAIRAAGAPVFGIPIDDRVASWADPARIATLGLAHESDEHIWARRIDPVSAPPVPDPPPGFTLAAQPPPAADLARLINLGWGLPPGHTRGRLFATALRIPEWRIVGVRAGDEPAGITILVVDTELAVGYLLLSVVLPAFRGRGLQTFFIDHRLGLAAAQGCTLAMTETNDDNASPRNMRRAGFRLAVTRRVYARRF